MISKFFLVFGVLSWSYCVSGFGVWAEVVLDGVGYLVCFFGFYEGEVGS